MSVEARWAPGRRLITVIVTVAALALVGVSPSAAAAPSATVQANNFRFCGADASACAPTDSGFQITVPTGTQVTWVYKDAECDALAPCPGHNVTFADTAGKTIKQEGATLLSRVFETPGRYQYRCTIHETFGMTGVVVVEGGAPSSAPSAPSPPSGELPKTGNGAMSLVALAALLIAAGSLLRYRNSTPFVSPRRPPLAGHAPQRPYGPTTVWLAERRSEDRRTTDAPTRRVGASPRPSA